MKMYTFRMFAILFFALVFQTQSRAVNETEVNNSIAQANYFAQGATMNGAISLTDQDDYFKAVTTQSGTVRLLFQYNNPALSVGPGLFVYVYNKQGYQIATKLIYNAPLGLVNDSLIITCREADTIYFRFNSTNSFSYSLQYLVTSVGTNDLQPNNSFAQAPYVAVGSTNQGRIGHTSLTTDIDDYYKIYLPTSGTFKLITTYNNTSQSTGSSFYTYIYNKNYNSIGTSFKYNQALGVAPADTLKLFCRGQDTIYIRFNVSGCFSYQFTYSVTPSGQEDQEPNNNFAQASFFCTYRYHKRPHGLHNNFYRR